MLLLTSLTGEETEAQKSYIFTQGHVLEMVCLCNSPLHLLDIELLQHKARSNKKYWQSSSPEEKP